MCSKSWGIRIYTQSVNANPFVGERPTYITTVRYEPKEYYTPVALEVRACKNLAIFHSTHCYLHQDMRMAPQNQHDENAT